MRKVFDYWVAEIDRNPVVLLPLLAFLATVWMNASTGYALADRSWGTGALFAIVALATAYFYTQGLAQRRWDARKGLLLLLATIGVAINLYSAWQTMGLNLADGAVKRDVKAKGVATVQRQLGDWEAERRKIGTVRAVGSIQADVTLECEKKSKLYPDGVGPKCTALRGEMAGAERAGELDRLIKAEMKGLEGREQVAAAGSELAVATRIAKAAGLEASAEQIKFWFMIVFALLIEALAALGFWLVGSGHGPAEAEPRRAHSLGAAAVMDAGPRAGVPLDFGGSRGLPPAAEQRVLAAPAGAGGTASAPVNVYIGMPQQAQDAGAAGVGRDQQSGTEAASSPSPRPAPRRDLPAVPADSPPVDRSSIARDLAPHEREAADVMLAFRAACVVASPGGVVALRNLYARYQHWAGERALEQDAFVALWPDVTGIALDPIGGSPHARGVGLRVGPALRVA